MNVGGQFKDKDPAEVVDVRHDWTFPPAMDGVTITGSLWTVEPSGLTIDSNAISGRATLARISGGTHSVGYVLTNRITCSDGQVFTAATYQPVRNKA